MPSSKDLVPFSKTHLGKALYIVLYTGVGVFIGLHVCGFLITDPFIALYVPWVWLLILLVALLVVIQVLDRRHELKEHDYN